MGGAGVLFVALGEGVLALEEGEGLLVLGEVGGCLTVLADAGEVKTQLEERVSVGGEIVEDSAMGPVVSKIGCGLSSGCW